MDLIRRHDAIDAFTSKYSSLDFMEDGVIELYVETIDKLPSAQQWIPCSERLPEVGRCVLLSVGGLYTAEGCLRDDGDWNQFRWDAIQRKDMVGAWMPLPEPFKGGDDA